jgi:hypothetical protein
VTGDRRAKSAGLEVAFSAGGRALRDRFRRPKAARGELHTTQCSNALSLILCRDNNGAINLGENATLARASDRRGVLAMLEVGHS